MDFNWFYAIGLFFVSLFLDAIFALYTVAVINKQAFKAAFFSLLTYGLMALGILSFVSDKIYVVPLALGAFAGSYIVVKREALKKQST